MKRIVIMAGGTGGHVYPAMAVAQVFQSKQDEVLWIGTKKGLEARVVPAAGLPIFWISISGLRGNGLVGWLLAPMRLILAIRQAMKILRTEKPDLALGLGGFVAGPGAIAAKLLGIPLVIHEQNAVAGLTNRGLFRFAKRVLQAFPATFKKDEKLTTVGNPVRADICQVKPTISINGRLKLLIVGGSLGAQALNEIMPKVLLKFKTDDAPQVWHQTGRNKLSTTKQAYINAGLSIANICEFIDDMSKAYAWADVVICRAGAMTVFEIAAAGKAAIFIPYPYAVDDHQTANAAYLADHGAAVIMPQSDMIAEGLYNQLQDFINNPETVIAMGQKAYARRIEDAAHAVADICYEVIEDD